MKRYMFCVAIRIGADSVFADFTISAKALDERLCSSVKEMAVAQVNRASSVKINVKNVAITSVVALED